MGKRKFFKPGIWIAATMTSAVLMTGLLVGGGFADQYAAQINSFFNTKEYELVKDPNSKEDTNYYKPKFATTDSEGNIVADKDKQYEYDKEKAREVNNEGAVLLWNNEKALPITSKNTKINLFGGRSANYYFVTDGSGGVRMSERPTLKEAFEQQGYTINSTLWDFYASHSYAGGTTSINETEYAAIDQSTLDSISGVGIYILSRKGSEGCDLYQKNTDGKNGSLTELSKQEIDTLNGMVSLKKQGKLEKAVVLLNTVSGGLQFSELSKFKNDIDACMWVGLGGTSGPNSVVDLVSGEANPSGRLSDTFVYDSFSAPATVNFSDFNYSNTESFSSDPIYQKLLRSQGNTDSTEKNLKYLVYQEGIYVGYKYYETRYEDCVLNRYNASSNAGVNNGYSSWNYDEQVAYPFGYGLSYTTFDYSDYKVDKTSNGYKVSIKVTNTGEVEGKDAVQIYLQKPYTDYDKENGIEQAAVNLIGFGKTDYLEPNESQLLSIDIDFNDFYTYDANNKQTYILEGGDYYLAFGDNAHSATNNILAAKGKVDGSVGDSSFAHKISYAQDLDGYKNPYGEGKVRNQFDDVDPNKADYKMNEVTYLSRSNWKDTYPQGVDIPLTRELLNALDYEKSFEDDEFGTIPSYGKDNGLNVVSLWKDTNGNDIPYDNENWEALLDQTTFEEQTYLVCNAWCATQAMVSVAAPGTENRDGPAGLNYLPDNKVIGLGMCYPSENIMASTFNAPLIEEIGECIGEDNLACGFTFIYAPGANIHRAAFGGRNGEYYSEDGYLSGIMCEYEVKGIQYNGAGAQIKHFALNDSEVNRNGVSIWANEQSIREIYLKAFEKACAKGHGEALSVMSSFTRAGALWTGAHAGMMTNVLRKEWGFLGFVQSDGNGYRLMSNYIDGIRAGNDLFMCGGGKRCLDAYKNSPTITQAMRESTHRVFYALTKTFAMNGLSSNVHIKSVTPWWRSAILALQITTISLTVVSAGLLTTSIVFKMKDKKKKEN